MQNKVTKEEMKSLPYIVAVDFDGTIVDDEYPEIGKLRKDVIDDILNLQKIGVKFILWTSRDGQQLQEAIDFCKDCGVIFDAINENLTECQEMFKNDTRKVYANEYWDDKAVGAYGESYLGESFRMLCKGVNNG